MLIDIILNKLSENAHENSLETYSEHSETSKTALFAEKK